MTRVDRRGELDTGEQRGPAGPLGPAADVTRVAGVEEVGPGGEGNGRAGESREVNGLRKSYEKAVGV